MLRSVTLGLALSLLAAACALVEPPVPATQIIEAEVRNRTPRQTDLGVTTPAGALRNAAQPASLPAGATAIVTFQVPIEGDWTIVLDPQNSIPADELEQYVAPGCTTYIQLDANGFEYGCDSGS